MQLPRKAEQSKNVQKLIKISNNIHKTTERAVGE